MIQVYAVCEERHINQPLGLGETEDENYNEAEK